MLFRPDYCSIVFILICIVRAILHDSAGLEIFKYIS